MTDLKEEHRKAYIKSQSQASGQDVTGVNWHCDEDDPFYCQNCGFSYEDTEETCPYH